MMDTKTIVLLGMVAVIVAGLLFLYIRNNKKK